MTNGEAINFGKMWLDMNEDAKDSNTYTFIKLAIKVLEQIELNSSYNSIKSELEPCGDCISRTELLSRIDVEREHLLGIKMDGAEHIIVHHARRIIEDMPSVTPTRPKGKWIILDECANEGVYCSECHKKVFKLEFSPTMKWRNFKYCPNCGAEMESEE